MERIIFFEIKCWTFKQMMLNQQTRSLRGRHFDDYTNQAS